MSYKVLITGGNGQLASSIKSIAPQNIDFIYLSSKDLDITNLKLVNKVFKENKIDWCVNCAAYTAVDKAEEEKEKAYLVNVIGTKNIALACKEYSVKLIHISTDFVFDGTTTTPYLEVSKTNPISVYGQTKLEGEKEIQKIHKEAIIIRTSWLYSEFNNNFMKTMLRLAESKEELNVVSDQIGTPTYAVDLADVIIKFISLSKSTFGLYHFSNKGAISWFDFAKAIFELKNKTIKVNPIPTSAYPTAAVRPKYSVLDKTKIEHVLSLKVSGWKESLTKALDNYLD